MLVTRIIFLSFQNDVNWCYSGCHSEKTENLAFSVDFRLIQNLSMLIFYYNVQYWRDGYPALLLLKVTKFINIIVGIASWNYLSLVTAIHIAIADMNFVPRSPSLVLVRNFAIPTYFSLFVRQTPTYRNNCSVYSATIYFRAERAISPRALVP